jgi:hypothetical protein
LRGGADTSTLSATASTRVVNARFSSEMASSVMACEICKVYRTLYSRLLS